MLGWMAGVKQLKHSILSILSMLENVLEYKSERIKERLKREEKKTYMNASFLPLNCSQILHDMIQV